MTAECRNGGSGGRGRSAAATALAFALAIGGAGPSAAQDIVEFKDLPTSALLELYTDVGLILQQREILSESWNPPQDYAERLVSKALELQPGDAPGRAVGSGGVRYRIVGLRLRDGDQPLRVEKLSESPRFDRLAVVVFEPDFEIAEAVVVPSDVAAARANDGGLTLAPEVIGAPGVEKITQKVYRFVGDDF